MYLSVLEKNVSQPIFFSRKKIDIVIDKCRYPISYSCSSIFLILWLDKKLPGACTIKLIMAIIYGFLK